MTIDQHIQELASNLQRIDPEDAITILRDATLRAKMLQPQEKRILTTSPASNKRISTMVLMERLRCKDEHVINLKRIGALRSVRVGKGDTFLESDVDAFIRSMEGTDFREDIRKKLRDLREETIERRKRKKA